jgi:predicted HTH transcriptional regulator
MYIHNNLLMNIHKDKIVRFVKKNRVITSSELAKFLKISWNTAEKNLLELVIDNKIVKIKKDGVNLWMLK